MFVIDEKSNILNDCSEQSKANKWLNFNPIKGGGGSI